MKRLASPSFKIEHPYNEVTPRLMLPPTLHRCGEPLMTHEALAFHGGPLLGPGPGLRLRFQRLSNRNPGLGKLFVLVLLGFLQALVGKIPLGGL